MTTAQIAPSTVTAEQVTSPHHPLLNAFEAGRWYALHGRELPGGATPDCWRGYWAEMDAKAIQD